MKVNFSVEKLYKGTNNKLKTIGLILILAGIGGATFPFWGGFFYERINPLERLGISELRAQEVSSDSLPLSDSVGRLVLESANVDMPLFVSDNDDALLKGGWVYEGNSRPGERGNTVIFGHRWLYKPPIKNTFFNLDKSELGDKFTITWDGETYTYEVSDIKIINPKDIWIMNQTDNPQVTLITCTPLFSVKQRLVVVGELID